MMDNKELGYITAAVTHPSIIILATIRTATRLLLLYLQKKGPSRHIMIQEGGLIMYHLLLLLIEEAKNQCIIIYCSPAISIFIKNDTQYLQITKENKFDKISAASSIS